MWEHATREEEQRGADWEHPSLSSVITTLFEIITASGCEGKVGGANALTSPAHYCLIVLWPIGHFTAL